MSVIFGDPYRGTPFNVVINGLKIRVGVLGEDLFLDPFYDRIVRSQLKGEDYTIEFPTPDRGKITLCKRWYNSSIICPVILTLFPTSWRKEEGLVRVPGYQRYRVKCNGEELKVWYSEEKKELYPPDFELLSNIYTPRKIMVAVGIDSKHNPEYPNNYNFN